VNFGILIFPSARDFTETTSNGDGGDPNLEVSLH
jgi:hypothetical protein